MPRTVLPRTAESYEAELAIHRRTEIELRNALSRDESLLRERDDLIARERELIKESDHRLLNNVQMIVSLLLLQSRGMANAEAASQLKVAAERVATIGRVHRRLHSCDCVERVAFKRYVEDLCRNFSPLLSPIDHPDGRITVEGSELMLPAATAVSLGFVVNELITNAAKYGRGRIAVNLGSDSGKERVVSISNAGPSLPDGFDPAKCNGLGMKIIRSFLERIDGKLQFGRGDNDQGTCFTVVIP